MNRRSQRLEVVLALARQRERRAASQLAEQIRDTLNRQQQQGQLQNFQQEYRQAFQGQLQQPRSIAELQNFQAFYRNLDSAMGRQQQQLELSRQQQQQARQQWQQAYARKNNMAELIARTEREEQAEQEQKQQRELDDRYNVSQSTFYKDN